MRKTPSVKASASTPSLVIQKPGPIKRSKKVIESSITTQLKAKEPAAHAYKTAYKTLDTFQHATPLQIIETERRGVDRAFLADIANRMSLSSSRLFEILAIPKATAERKGAKGQLIDGSAGQAAVSMAKLLRVAQQMADNSTAAEAKHFDAARWLGQWIECPQPALGGRKPADLLDTPTGFEIVTRVLGSLQSGAYL